MKNGRVIASQRENAERRSAVKKRRRRRNERQPITVNYVKCTVHRELLAASISTSVFFLSFFFSQNLAPLSPWTFIFHPCFTRLKITRRLKIPANEIGSVSVGGGKSSSTQFFLLTETQGRVGSARVRKLWNRRNGVILDEDDGYDGNR